jgi:nucleotide-binding universal stress UspA family protein
MAATRNPRVVVGVDLSLAGLQALRFAVAEARRRGTSLRAVRAWQFGPGWYGLDVGPHAAALADEAAMTILSAFQQAMGGLPGDVRVDAQAIEGPAAVVLVDQASSADDLLVVGRSGRHLPGSPRVDVRCLRSASCPVVAVPAPVPSEVAALRRDLVSEAEALLRSSDRPTSPA